LTAFTGKKFRVYNANTFASSFASDPIYLYVGRTEAWDDDEAPPSANDTPQGHKRIWDRMLGAIRVNRNQVALGIARNEWASGTKYNMYHHANTVAMANNYFVVNKESPYNVYKCLDNNGYEPSTVEPVHTNLGITKEIDGYYWKYMYTIPDTVYTHLITDNVIPVFRNSSVSSLSRNGSILNLPISANNTEGIGAHYRGLGFVNTSYQTDADTPYIFTTVWANTSTNEIKVAAASGFAPADDYYNNCAFFVTSGGAKGTYRRIIDSKSSDTINQTSAKSTNLVLSSAVSNFANGDDFIIGPMVVVANELAGRNFLAMGRTNKYGNVTSIDVNQSGFGYANGDATVLINGYYHPAPDNPDGTGATTELIIPPTGGHGFNAYTELDARYVIVAPETTTPPAGDHETGSFIGYGNDIRQYGLLRGPIDAYSKTTAYGFSYDLKTTIYFKNATAINFAVDDRVYNTGQQGGETASGTVWNICGNSPNEYISLVDVQGQFANGDILYNRKGDVARIHSASLSNFEYPLNSGVSPFNPVVGGQLTKYTGEIIYHENIKPITRAIDQKESFQVIFEF
jgi:hypothetical protein